MRKIAVLFILIGLVFIGIGGYQYFKIQAAERQALESVEVLLDEHRTNKMPMELFEPNHGDEVGLLIIDKIDARLPIVEGTDPDDLEKGVGHHAATAYPGQQDQILLSGHRDTVFTKLGDVEVGDIITISLPYGDFNYKMVDSKIVDADDRTIIGSTAPDEELIISTCYPFGYVGNAPDRYLIYAVPYEE
ncbi:sortase A [Amphibacillus marinus]|uniref:Sortase A n=1 Tax=Amphibacillus marinus TaxID=872970 RepID=A0A1H8QX55_9BACI|nr:class D sortase [Amphibacillus marinus]SEO58745.1 sortase A [Amphibacillus marinus]